MKKVFIYILLLTIFLLNSGCIRVEDNEEDNNNETTVSTATIKAGKSDFTLEWLKNTNNYGQLEITDDVTTSKSIVSFNGKKSVSLECIFDNQKNKKKLLNDYQCSISEGIVGTFPLTFSTDKELLIIERSGKTSADDFLVMSQMVLIDKSAELDNKESTSPTTPSSNTPEPSSSINDKVLTIENLEAVGNNCAYGGTRIDIGKDINGNNKLDKDEIEKTSYICNDAPAEAPSSLLNTTEEAVGNNCAYGGTRIDIGKDINGNNKLDKDEIEKTSYICNDAPEKK